MTRRLLFTYLTVTAFVLLVLELPLGLSFADRERTQLLNGLESDARVLATAVDAQLQGEGSGPEPASVALEYQDQTGARVVIVDKDGVTVIDSADPNGAPRDFSTRDEIAIALTGNVASGLRHSDMLDTDLIFVAVPVASAGDVMGAVRITYTSAEIDARVRSNWWRLGLLSALVLSGVAVLGSVLAGEVRRPLEALRRAAATIASGDLSARARVTSGPPEVRALATTFDEMAARLEELVDAQRAFVADASHQLRTPLTALRLRLEGLTAAELPRQETLEAALQEVDRLSRLVDGLLALARMEGGRPPLVEVDAAAVARERAETWQPFAEEHGMELTCEAPATATARAVSGGLEQVLDNYLANALEVAPAGSVVAITVEVGPEVVVVTVSDEGPGLADEELARAFDRFWRSTNRQGGSGLGLAIVRQVARASGGDAELQRCPDGGLAAIVSLPRADP